VTKSGFIIDGSTVQKSLPKPGHLKHQLENREFVTLTFDNMTFAGQQQDSTQSLIEAVIPKICECLEKCCSAFQADVFLNMYWVDTANRQPDPLSDLPAMFALVDKLEVSLAVHNTLRILRILYNNTYLV
jgi:hypothetical protein